MAHGKDTWEVVWRVPANTAHQSCRSANPRCLTEMGAENRPVTFSGVVVQTYDKCQSYRPARSAACHIPVPFCSVKVFFSVSEDKSINL